MRQISHSTVSRIAPGSKANACRRIALALLLWAGWALAAPAAAAESLADTEAIFLGSLLHKDSFFSDDGRLIWTRHLFAVEEGVRGPASGTVEILELGGTVGDVSLRVSHGVVYEFGQSYLIFARRDEEGRLRTRDGTAGRLPVFKDGSGAMLVRVRGGGPLFELLGEPRRAFHNFDEIRARLAALEPDGGGNR